MKVIQAAQVEIDKMPKVTTAQRIARSTKYQELTHAGFAKLYGRKA